MRTIIKHNLLICTLACVIALVGSCDQFVEVDQPQSQLTAPTVFEDMATANAAMTSVYSKMRDRGLLTGAPSGMSLQLGNYTDELTYFGASQTATADFFNNAVPASSTDSRDKWNYAYNQVYAANAVLFGVEQSTTLSEVQRNQLKGEALFTRALLHFYLVNLYGDVPYVTSTDYVANSTLGRTPTVQVYAALKADLATAATLLPEAYNGTNRVRPNRFTVRALLARVNLYLGLWAEAANDASAVLNATSLYSMETNPDNVFVKTSLSTIWQFGPAVPSNNTQEGNTFIFTTGPPTLSALSTTLVNAFAAGDQRRSLWVTTVGTGSNIWYRPNKYKRTLSNGGTQEFSIVLRLEEQYLIRAEARAMQGDLTGAKQDLNRTRNRAGLGNSTAVTAADIVAAVDEERRFEFFTEHGHRFFDLKRRGTLNAVLIPLKPGWTDSDKLLPLPAAELLLNPNLNPQNPGY